MRVSGRWRRTAESANYGVSLPVQLLGQYILCDSRARADIIDDYRSKGQHDWYFAYHKLWMQNSPAAIKARDAAKHPLAQAALASASLRSRIGAGGVSGELARRIGQSRAEGADGDDEEDIVEVDEMPKGLAGASRLAGRIGSKASASPRPTAPAAVPAAEAVPDANGAGPSRLTIGSTRPLPVVPATAYLPSPATSAAGGQGGSGGAPLGRTGSASKLGKRIGNASTPAEQVPLNRSRVAAVPPEFTRQGSNSQMNPISIDSDDDEEEDVNVDERHEDEPRYPRHRVSQSRPRSSGPSTAGPSRSRPRLNRPPPSQSSRDPSVNPIYTSTGMPTPSPDLTPPLDETDLARILEPRKHARDMAIQKRLAPIARPVQDPRARQASSSSLSDGPSSDEDEVRQVPQDHYGGLLLDQSGPTLSFSMTGNTSPIKRQQRRLSVEAARPPTPPLPAAKRRRTVLDQARSQRKDEEMGDVGESSGGAKHGLRPATPPLADLPRGRQQTSSSTARRPLTPPLPSSSTSSAQIAPAPISKSKGKSAVSRSRSPGFAVVIPLRRPCSSQVKVTQDRPLTPPLPPPQVAVPVKNARRETAPVEAASPLEDEDDSDGAFCVDGLEVDEEDFLSALGGVIGMSP